MNVIDIRNHRAWLKDLNSDRTHTAWLGQFDGKSLSMEIVGPHKMEVGEQWICSVNRSNASNQFLMCITEVDGAVIHADLTSSLHQSSKKGDARLRAAFIMKVWYDDQEIDARVVDVSIGGLGFIASEELKQGKIVRCTATTDDEEAVEINLMGRVVHCRPNSEGSGFRIGVALDNLNRLDEARWLVFLSNGDQILLQTRRAAS